MRQLVGLVVAAAMVAAAVYLTFEFTFFEPNGDAVTDLSLPTLLLLGALIAAILALGLGVAAEVRQLRNRRRDRDWSLTMGGGPRA
jgi:hypothetical protein